MKFIRATLLNQYSYSDCQSERQYTPSSPRLVKPGRPEGGYFEPTTSVGRPVRWACK